MPDYEKKESPKKVTATKGEMQKNNDDFKTLKTSQEYYLKSIVN